MKTGGLGTRKCSSSGRIPGNWPTGKGKKKPMKPFGCVIYDLKPTNLVLGR